MLAIFPFTFEGKRRRRQAQETTLALRATADAVRVFENDALLRSGYESLDLQGAYLKRDERLWEIIISKVPPGTGDCARERLPS